MGIILIIVIAGLAVWLLTSNHETGRGSLAATTSAKCETALEILRQRYARGEIGRDEFKARGRDLA